MRLPLLAGAATLALGAGFGMPAWAQGPEPIDVVMNWNRMVLELVRHTPTYSPPVASRAFGYLGVISYEAAAGGNDAMHTLAGQLNGLDPLPVRDPDATYDEAVIMQAALAFGVENFFGNTGPTGQRAMTMMEQRLGAAVVEDVPEEIVAASTAYGEAIGQHILAWSLTDGGAVVENLGFPYEYTLIEGADHWVPTNRIAVQQTPLLPEWGNNRPFAMPAGSTCQLPPPPAYSEAPESAFYRQAMEVYEAVNALDAEQEAIARFWSDDPMLSPTPPGHWFTIALDALEAEQASFEDSVDLIARLGIGLADAFIGCWDAKYQFDLVRPVTYINRFIDEEWQPILITPPFPEYPSGHSTQSGTAAAVLEHYFGLEYGFSDSTHEADGLAVRSYETLWDAAEEAAISRLYGGIHFRAAIDNGLDQGRCIADYTNALTTLDPS